MMTQAEIYTWLVDRVAKVLKIKPDQVDVNTDFDRYGFESADVVALMVDLEDKLGFEIEDPSLLYIYSTIEKLAQYLASLS